METKDLEYWKNNCEEDYLTTPISVLRYISELEKAINYAQFCKPLTEKNEFTILSDGFRKGCKKYFGGKPSDG